jgi:hypothetical protein
MSDAILRDVISTTLDGLALVSNHSQDNAVNLQASASEFPTRAWLVVAGAGQHGKRCDVE